MQPRSLTSASPRLILCVEDTQIGLHMAEDAQSNDHKYHYPAVTVDVVIFTLEQGSLHVLLVERKQEPFEGVWAIPGGFVHEEEPLESAARRELAEETG